MSEKGGKGFPVSKGVKSSLKTPSSKEAPLKGKDDNSTQSKRGRKKKVQFNSEGSMGGDTNFSSKSGGKGEIPTTKVDLDKVGKGGKALNGGKSTVPKAPAPLELKIEQELPKNVKCMMDCEAAYALQGIQEQMIILSEDPTIKLPPSFDRGLQYAKTGSSYTNPQSVRRVLETLKIHGALDGEICMIANVCPDSVDEVFALMPSLKAKRGKLREPLRDALSELATLKPAS